MVFPSSKFKAMYKCVRFGKHVCCLALVTPVVGLTKRQCEALFA
jgi:hypothetical protein